MQSFSRLIRDINGEKNISLLMIFFTVSFSRFAPSRVIFPFFYAFFVFLRIFSLLFAFLHFLRFSLLLLKDKGKQQQNLLQKRGISLRPRLHRPRAKLPDVLLRERTRVEKGGIGLFPLGNASPEGEKRRGKGGT